MSKTIIDGIKKDAEALYTLRALIKEKKDSHKIELDKLEVEKEACEAVLMAQMKKVGISSLKVPSGDTVAMATKPGLEVTSEAHAFQWAIDHKAVSINKILVAQLLKDATEIPDGFQRVTREYIRVTKPKGATEE